MTGRWWTPTAGGSMRPLLRAGWRVEVDADAAAALRPGDIAVFRRGRSLVVHRVAAVARCRRDCWLTEAGDATNVAPRPRPAEEVVGRVTALSTADGRRLDLTAGWGRWAADCLDRSWPARRWPRLPRALMFRLVEEGLRHVAR